MSHLGRKNRKAECLSRKYPIESKKSKMRCLGRKIEWGVKVKIPNLSQEFQNGVLRSKRFHFRREIRKWDV